ncbi:MAG: CBS domain-containing protein [Myxococcales bacterium]|nr:CBS domain-containing protein [Myxococcales bacterium]
MAIIRSLMKTEMVTVKPDDSVADAARLMAQNQVGAALVVEDGAMKGIVSERDVVTRVVAEGKDPAATKVSEISTSAVVHVDVDTHVRKCAELQSAMGVRHLPVTENGAPVGILSSRDLLAYVVEGLEQVIDKIGYEDALGKGEDPYDHMGGSYGK